MTPDTPDTSVLKFPCVFPIKILGLANAAFETAALAIVRQYVDDLREDAIRTRLSKDGKYMAITVVINAVSREQLDNIYLALTAAPEVLMAL